jgi:23S rRNA (cytosine1962-C5)-methyltransferase
MTGAAPVDLTAFANRLRKNQRHWNKWARRRGISCYRLYDRDIPEVPLAIDWYEGRVHAQQFARADSSAAGLQQDRAIEGILCEVLDIGPEALAFKIRQRQRGLAQYEKRGGRGRPIVVHEAGLAFEVDLHTYLDTGLFLDHRITRQRLREQAADRRVLNLFAYTGSFTVYAASGDAATTTSVDLSNTYLDWGRRNLRLNDLDAARHRFVRMDVLRYLAQAHRQGERFDLIILDPPSFSNSKKMQENLDVQRDHARLIQDCQNLLATDGELLFSTNRRRFRLDPRLGDSGLCEEITRQTLPEDFQRHPAHRCWRCRKP